jgi:hypothetical protein
VNWQAPREHSRRDWIGIYRVGANKSNLVTKVVSQGKWVPVHDEEWDGDFPKPLFARVEGDSKSVEKGQVVFKSSTLPWETGRYEVSSIYALAFILVSGVVFVSQSGMYYSCVTTMMASTTSWLSQGLSRSIVSPTPPPACYVLLAHLGPMS